MNRNRLILRLVLIAVAVAIFFARGGYRRPDFMKGFLAALAVAVIILVVRTVMEAKKSKQSQPQGATNGNKVELFSKPKDF